MWLRELAEGIGGAKESLDGTNLPSSVLYVERTWNRLEKSLKDILTCPHGAVVQPDSVILSKEIEKKLRKGNGRYRTDNPFIYGLRKITPRNPICLDVVD